ncbi:MAG TPA: hypothetical protein VF186_10535 [Gaiellaceae bacterium]
MRKMIVMGVMVAGLVVVGSGLAALSPWTYDPGNTGCVSSSYSGDVLHLSKSCPTTTNASAGASLTGLAGQTFGSASFTLAGTNQCQGGSPRFNVVTSNGTSTTTYFLGCNNVTPTVNGDGTATYTFDAATVAAAGNQVPFPAGTITSVDVLIDVQGSADLSAISVNGQPQVPTPETTGPTAKDQCKKGGWRSFTSPSFKNQGQCVSWFEHQQHHSHRK